MRDPGARQLQRTNQSDSTTNFLSSYKGGYGSVLSGAGSEDMTATIAVVVDGKGYSEAVSPEGAAAECLHVFRSNYCFNYP